MYEVQICPSSIADLFSYTQSRLHRFQFHDANPGSVPATASQVASPRRRSGVAQGQRPPDVSIPLGLAVVIASAIASATATATADTAKGCRPRPGIGLAAHRASLDSGRCPVRARRDAPSASGQCKLRALQAETGRPTSVVPRVAQGIYCSIGSDSRWRASCSTAAALARLRHPAEEVSAAGMGANCNQLQSVSG